MSSEAMRVLLGAVPAFEMFISHWEKLSRECPHLDKFIKHGLEWAYMYYERMDCTHAYVLAMCR